MTISVGNLIVAGGASVDTSEVLSALNKQGLKVWVGTKTQRDALPENVKSDDKITFLTYDSEEDIYLIVDTIISYSKTWSSVKISTELAKKINSSDVYTKTEVMSLINSKVASALKYRGAVATVAALPSSGQENGDSYYVQADGYMYAWSSDYSDWQALGSATDMTNYYTKSEVDALLADMAVKFQYTTMPTADSTTVGKIIQYTGADTNDYKNGYWYKGVDNGDSTYSWALYTDDKYALSVYSNDLQLTYEGSSYATTSALITQLTTDIVARKHSSGTVGGNISITWTGKSCVVGSYSIHSGGAGFVVLDFENTQDGNKHCIYYISNGSATGITWSNLATTSDVVSYVKDKMSCYTWGTDKTLRAVFYEVTDRGILPDVTDTVGKRIIARYGNALINRITQVSGTKNFYWDNTLVLSCPFNDDTTKLTNVLEIFVGTTAWQQFVADDDIFLVGDRRNTIGWADLSNSVDIDGSSNYANNIGRIEGHNAIIEVSNPTIGYQWPVTNSGDSNKFMDFGGAIQFFVDKVNNHLYVRFADSADMSAWGEIATESNAEGVATNATGVTGTVKWYRRGHVVTVDIQALTLTGTERVTTIASGLPKPLAIMYSNLNNSIGSSSCYPIAIYSDGSLTIHANAGATPAVSSTYGGMTYLTDDY